MKRVFTILLVLVFVFAFATCGQSNQAGDRPEQLKAAFITASPLGNDYIDMIWRGFLRLESEGWSVRSIEALDAVDHEDSIRAMANEGYDVIMLFGGELIQVGVDLSQDLKDINPNLHIFALDTERELSRDNITSVATDPFEASFVAGYVAAMSTETGTVGVIMHSDSPGMRRFSMGYYAGVEYANNGTNVVTAISGSPFDVSLAYEATLTMIASFPVDIIYHAAYIAGLGVIRAGAEMGIRIIGVDDWQGYIDDAVFWSALKPMETIVAGIANMYKDGVNLPTRLNFDFARGNRLFDDRDFERLPLEHQNNVARLMDGIANGTIDVYRNYPQMRMDF